jgi:hypothetical protein
LVTQKELRHYESFNAGDRFLMHAIPSGGERQNSDLPALVECIKIATSKNCPFCGNHIDLCFGQCKQRLALVGIKAETPYCVFTDKQPLLCKAQSHTLPKFHHCRCTGVHLTYVGMYIIMYLCINLS